MDNWQLHDAFRMLTRHTLWEQKARISVPFNHYHAQGMIRDGGLFYLSSVELLEAPAPCSDSSLGYDRTTGKGVGHLYVMDERGRLLHDLVLGEGAMYHPGGIDTDGSHLWIPVAEYRPHSQAIIYKVEIETMQVEEVFRVQDHIGGLICDRHSGTLIGHSWGSRKFYRWTPHGNVMEERNNSSHFIDYQDGQYIGGGCMLLSGIAELSTPVGHSGSAKVELGGLALLDTRTMTMVHEVPVTEYSVEGHVLTRNPVYVEYKDQVLRFYAVPDDGFGDMLIYETSI
ncbi:DUF6454 family protein [Paenibacillus aestuarii]|uniref:DUF6454 family protein n=1 Tax=Paenibacillus aestuarii TaxID=516965 RepID=A0ABW0KEP7_9BACL|nr:DUF6454 family protein [Paenibacillus aestuarii]